MTFRCKRCEEKGLRCFVDTATGRCAGCISVKAECSLFVTEEEWEKVEADKRQKRLALLRAEAEVARLRLEVAETEALERSYADRDHAILKQAEGSSAPGGTGLPVVEPPLSELSTDLGWLQADSFDPSFDYSFLFEGLPLASPGASGGIHVLVTCSSSGFLQVPKCYGFRAILAT
ncbi:hypothetical protein COCSADRAFT_36701 [Bipolaris sorokiniana ND90Pr]|uniref:Zn(2)-C6 fungal-type domain-containing protein n=1 Tax=Cochliobolus sativus (strain ND90Pr / ATCC 201652) TaxID=665912 RepID=M2SA01_COCSN|nr:uncharacterized protein COCSADRAFT_36701 [Bipolaris sorokiniana ND90Pr]EMD64123.1 hypothetical protein COCSADRAFT_36701 [Bipolaris sorokiniana ND90Pr]